MVLATLFKTRLSWLAGRMTPSPCDITSMDGMQTLRDNTGHALSEQPAGGVINMHFCCYCGYLLSPSLLVEAVSLVVSTIGGWKEETCSASLRMLHAKRILAVACLLAWVVCSFCLMGRSIRPLRNPSSCSSQCCARHCDATKRASLRSRISFAKGTQAGDEKDSESQCNTALLQKRENKNDAQQPNSVPVSVPLAKNTSSVGGIHTSHIQTNSLHRGVGAQTAFQLRERLKSLAYSV